MIEGHESGGRSPGLGGGDTGCLAGRGSLLKWCESADGDGEGGCVRSQAPESASESDWMDGKHAQVWAARQRVRLKVNKEFKFNITLGKRFRLRCSFKTSV